MTIVIDGRVIITRDEGKHTYEIRYEETGDDTYLMSGFRNGELKSQIKASGNLFDVSIESFLSHMETFIKGYK